MVAKKRVTRVARVDVGNMMISVQGETDAPAYMGSTYTDQALLIAVLFKLCG